jgi:hypothetical protein
MKKLAFLSILAFCLSGCATTTYYYQLYKTEPDDVNKNNKKSLVYEGVDIDIYSDLWTNYGNSGFYIFNKTDSNIYIDLGQSHFIVNGVAQTYFQNRIFTESSSSSISVGSSYYTGYGGRSTYAQGYGNASYSSNYTSAISQASSYSSYRAASTTTAIASTTASGHSVSYGEMRVWCIPPKAGKVVDGFIITSVPYRDCDLYRFPGRKEKTSKKFTPENSPLKFKNLITYGFNENVQNGVTIELNYYVSEITNFFEDNFVTPRQKEYCGQKSLQKEYVYNYWDPQCFFIQYKKPSEVVFDH